MNQRIQSKNTSVGTATASIILLPLYNDNDMVNAGSASQVAVDHNNEYHNNDDNDVEQARERERGGEEKKNDDSAETESISDLEAHSHAFLRPRPTATERTILLGHNNNNEGARDPDDDDTIVEAARPSSSWSNNNNSVSSAAAIWMSYTATCSSGDEMSSSCGNQTEPMTPTTTMTGSSGDDEDNSLSEEDLRNHDPLPSLLTTLPPAAATTPRRRRQLGPLQQNNDNDDDFNFFVDNLEAISPLSGNVSSQPGHDVEAPPVAENSEVRGSNNVVDNSDDEEAPPGAEDSKVRRSSNNLAPGGSPPDHISLNQEHNEVMRILQDNQQSLSSLPRYEHFGQCFQDLLKIAKILGKINKRRLNSDNRRHLCERPRELSPKDKQRLQEIVKAALSVADKLIDLVPVNKLLDIFLSKPGEEDEPGGYNEGLLEKLRRKDVFFDRITMKASNTADPHREMFCHVLSARIVVSILTIDYVCKKWPLAEFLCGLARLLRHRRNNEKSQTELGDRAIQQEPIPLIVDAMPGTAWLNGYNKSDDKLQPVTWFEHLKLLLPLGMPWPEVILMKHSNKQDHRKEVVKNVKDALMVGRQGCPRQLLVPSGWCVLNSVLKKGLSEMQRRQSCLCILVVVVIVLMIAPEVIVYRRVLRKRHYGIPALEGPPTASPLANTTSFSRPPTASPQTKVTIAPTSPTKAPVNPPPTTSPTPGQTSSPQAHDTHTSPTLSPTMTPTVAPTGATTREPSTLPPSTLPPSDGPSTSPTLSPTVMPTAAPTVAPTTLPPSKGPSASPTLSPTVMPTAAPSERPTTESGRSVALQQQQPQRGENCDPRRSLQGACAIDDTTGYELACRRPSLEENNNNHFLCLPALPQGAHCRDRKDCEPGLQCDLRNNSNVCVPGPVLGDSCAFVDLDDSETTSLVDPAVDPSAACSHVGVCEPRQLRCRRFIGLAEAAKDPCGTTHFDDNNSTTTSSVGYLFCQADLTCLDGICQARLAAGSSRTCTQQRDCRADAWCNTTTTSASESTATGEAGRCVPLSRENEPCELDSHCVSNLQCSTSSSSLSRVCMPRPGGITLPPSLPPSARFSRGTRRRGENCNPAQSLHSACAADETTQLEMTCRWIQGYFQCAPGLTVGQQCGFGPPQPPQQSESETPQPGGVAVPMTPSLSLLGNFGRDCEPGLVCENQQCVPGPGLGDVCDATSSSLVVDPTQACSHVGICANTTSTNSDSSTTPTAVCRSLIATAAPGKDPCPWDTPGGHLFCTEDLWCAAATTTTETDVAVLGVCRPRIAVGLTTTATESMCHFSHECDDGGWCSRSQCIPLSHEGQECNQDFDCVGNLACSPQTFRCTRRPGIALISPPPTTSLPTTTPSSLPSPHRPPSSAPTISPPL